VQKSKGPGSHVLFSKESISQYNGINSSLLYMAVLGDVFDVSEKQEFYGKQVREPHPVYPCFSQQLVVLVAPFTLCSGS
jgi:hypothetical protein